MTTPFRVPSRGEPGGGAPTALPVFEPVGAVHLLADVFGDLLVQQRLLVGALVLDGVRAPLWEQRPAVEGLKLLLDHPAHDVLHVCGAGAVAAHAREPVAVMSARKSWKFSCLPLCGVAVISSRCRVTSRSFLPSW